MSEREFKKILKEVLEKYCKEGETPKSINAGLCDYFANDVMELVDKRGIKGVRKGAKGIHTFSKFQGKYYDSEKINGVSIL